MSDFLQVKEELDEKLAALRTIAQLIFPDKALFMFIFESSTINCISEKAFLANIITNIDDRIVITAMKRFIEINEKSATHSANDSPSVSE